MLITIAFSDRSSICESRARRNRSSLAMLCFREGGKVRIAPHMLSCGTIIVLISADRFSVCPTLEGVWSLLQTPRGALLKELHTGYLGFGGLNGMRHRALDCLKAVHHQTNRWKAKLLGYIVEENLSTHCDLNILVSRTLGLCLSVRSSETRSRIGTRSKTRMTMTSMKH
jgi:hypothetical protein